MSAQSRPHSSLLGRPGEAQEREEREDPMSGRPSARASGRPDLRPGRRTPATARLGRLGTPGPARWRGFGVTFCWAATSRRRGTWVSALGQGSGAPGRAARARGGVGPLPRVLP